ncbi:hypothetical protein BDD12DRAFT_157573 [Trichophaea hybrida]|nr:hypothetical protein BDD12DRAFT_157573 [Trichophaea hybrida]
MHLGVFFPSGGERQDDLGPSKVSPRSVAKSTVLISKLCRLVLKSSSASLKQWVVISLLYTSASWRFACRLSKTPSSHFEPSPTHTNTTHWW